MNYVIMTLVIGFATGLRSFTPPALVAWAAHLGWLNLNNSPVAFMGSTVAVVIFSILALFELVGDVLPQTPKRTALVPLIARILMGALCGACLQFAVSNQGWIGGAILGAVGAVIGAFAGYEIRKRLVAALKIKDLFFALLEDLIAIALAYLAVAR